MLVLDLNNAWWRKSGRSTATSNCVEVAFVDVTWHKSSRSTDKANCVEVAFSGPVVGVRDTKDRDGAVLAFPAKRWSDFVGKLR